MQESNPTQKNTEAEDVTAQRVCWSGMTHVGRFRKNNEDAFLALEMDGTEVRYLGKVGEGNLKKRDFIFAVSDGMGGAKAGEFASSIAVDRITQLLPKAFRSAAAGMEIGFTDILEQLFDQIHQRLTSFSRSYDECHGMGATLSLCWIRPEWLYFGHIGDTRIYHFPASGGIRQVTEDHTHVGWLRRQGKINERQERTHPQRSQLQQVLGGKSQFLSPHIGRVGYEVGDRFLICSDGLLEGHWEAGLERGLRERPKHEERPPAQYLVESSVATAGKDNATAVVIEIR